jgi:hypothetical protein
MRPSDRARAIGLALLAAISGSASVGIAALARAGFCVHRLGLFGLHPRADAMAMPGMDMSGMNASGMSMPGMAMSDGSPCPILMGVAAFGALSYIVALIALIVVRPSMRELAVTSARLVAGVRFAPLALILALVGAVPIGAMIVADGTPAAGGIAIASVFLAAGAVVLAAVLAGAARVVLAFARRVVVAWLTVLRLLAADAAALLLPRRRALVPVRIRAARRRPSRAPPVRSRR